MDKITLRPIISSAKYGIYTSEVETFQNQVLRPIIKLQHDIIMVTFKNFLKSTKVERPVTETYQKNEYIKNSLSKNLALRNQYIGMVIGMFTLEETNLYLPDANAHHKRIIQMIVQRIQDTL